MPKTKKELAKELDNIEKKLLSLLKDIASIRKKAQNIQKQASEKRDGKKIMDLKNKINSL